MLIARQATLGCLTTVSVSAGDMVTAEFQLVLDQLLHTQGLTSIKVESCWDRNSVRVPLGLALPKAAKSDAVPASLRKLEYQVHDDPRLLCYLQWHADTLQELRCDMMDNMQALLQCPSLKTVYLNVRANDSTPQFLPGAEQYLRQAVADRLENLTLQYDEEDDVDPEYTASFDSAVDLVLSLAGPSSSAPSALRSLNLAYMFRRIKRAQPQPQLEPLAAVLPRLDNLVSLDLGGPPTDDFLAALDGRVLPRLEQLRLFLSDSFCGCPHKWAHGPEPRALLRKYPRLHLDVYPMHITGCDECDQGFTDHYGWEQCHCDYCMENTCHYFRSREQTLFSHPEHEVCNQEHSIFGDMRIDL